MDTVREIASAPTAWQRAKQVYTCTHTEKQVRFKVSLSSSKLFYLQCVKCGDLIRLAKDKVTNPGSPQIKPVDESLAEKWYQATDSLYKKYLKEEEAELQRAKEKERQEWWDWYNLYLLSPEWSKKRVAVMKRANFICEGCLEKTAAQVHHLTYKRVGKEMLFDLVAVCHDCHRTIHDSENGA